MKRECNSDPNYKTTGFGKFEIHYLKINVSKQLCFFFFIHRIFGMFSNSDISKYHFYEKCSFWKQVA